jgi:5-methylcytosine-specific restriction endonuclease McrA
MYGMYPSETFVENGKVFRRCIFCGAVKPIVDYPRNGLDENGEPAYRQDCKTCYNLRRRENKSKSKKRHSDFVGGQKRRGDTTINLSHQEWKEALIFFGGECAYCGCTPRRNQHLTRDHLEPVSKGGETTQDNIVPSCSTCNSSKGAEDFKDWFMKQPFFSQERLNRIFKWRSIMRQIRGGGDKDERY